MEHSAAAKDEMGRVVAEVAGIGVLFALVHSALASVRAKHLARQLAGPRYRNGLYRLLFNVQSGISLGFVLARIARLPDRPLYRVPAPWSWLMYLGQALFALMGLAAVRVVGMPWMAGVAEAKELLDEQSTRPEPEAQGPPPESARTMKIEGPFKYTRHPINWSPLGIFLLFPKMTLKGAVMVALSAVYLIIGSVHEETRLLDRYGGAYLRYQREVPFLFPRPGRKING